jgi:hypothetical protein
MGRFTGLATSVLDSNTVSYDEVSYAADAVFQRGGLHVQAEVMGRDRDFLEGRRSAIGTGFAPNGRDLGAYGLVGHRFDRAWNVMPFVLAEYYRPVDRAFFAKMRSITGGLNFRPTPTIVLKAQVSAAQTEGSGQFGELGRLYDYTAQAAWVF